MPVETTSVVSGPSIESQQIQPFNNDVQAIVEFAPPRNIRQLRRFCKLLLPVHSGSCPSMGPYLSTTPQRCHFEWSPGAPKAFDLAKEIRTQFDFSTIIETPYYAPMHPELVSVPSRSNRKIAEIIYRWGTSQKGCYPTRRTARF